MIGASQITIDHDLGVRGRASCTDAKTLPLEKPDRVELSWRSERGSVASRDRSRWGYGVPTGVVEASTSAFALAARFEGVLRYPGTGVLSIGVSKAGIHSFGSKSPLFDDRNSA